MVRIKGQMQEIYSRRWTRNGWAYSVLTEPNRKEFDLSTEAVQERKGGEEALRQWLERNDPTFFGSRLSSRISFAEWRTLPPELVLLVASFFETPKTLARLSMTSKAWRVTALTGRLWAPHVHKHYPHIQVCMELLPTPDDIDFAKIYRRQAQIFVQHDDSEEEGEEEEEEEEEEEVTPDLPPSSSMSDFVFSIRIAGPGGPSWIGRFDQNMVAEGPPTRWRSSSGMTLPLDRFDKDEIALAFRSREASVCWLDITVTRLVNREFDTVVLVESTQARLSDGGRTVTWECLLPLSKSLDPHGLGISKKITVNLFDRPTIHVPPPASGMPVSGMMTLDFGRDCSSDRILCFLDKYLPWIDMPGPSGAVEKQVVGGTSAPKLVAQLRAVKQIHDSGELSDAEFASWISSLLE